MRILHVHYIARLSGAESLGAELAIQHTHDGQCVAVTAFAPPEQSFRPTVERLRSESVDLFFPPHTLGRMERLRWTRRICSEFRPDVVVAHSVIPAAYTRVALWGVQPNPKVVSVLHSSCEDDYRPLRYRLPELLLSGRAAAVVTVSPAARRNYCARIGDHSRVETIPNGIRVQRFRRAFAQRHSYRQRLGVSATGRVILQAGRFGRVKNQVGTIEAFAELSRTRKDVALWLAGIEEDREYLLQLRELCRGLAVDERVTILGAREDMPELLAAADTFAMPSLQEAFAVGLLEALAAGVPIVASAIMPFEFARRYADVTLVDPRDVSAYAAALGRAVDAKRVERDMRDYEIERTALRYMELFESVCRA